jgi:hypothetical protein
LQSGDLYFNTTDDVMKVREAGAWLAAFASLSGALLAANNLSDLTNKTTARQNLDLEIGVDVQAYDAQLADVAGLSPADNNFIVGNGTNFVAESGSTARTSLGLGSIATQDSSNVTVTGGSINGTTVGASTASTGKFTTLDATGVTTVQAGTNSAPAITTTGDTNTGMFFPAADTVAASAGGTERMRIDSAGNVGVRSSGGTTPTYDFSTLGEGLWSRYWDNSGARTADLVAIGNTPAGATQIMRFLTNTGGSPGTAVERGRFDASGNFLFNSGYGSVATAYGCRAWVNFNGTGTVAIRASGNVSSITDGGTGVYTVNFTTAMPDADYSASVVPSSVPTVSDVVTIATDCNPSSRVNPTTSAFIFSTFNAQFASIDTQFLRVAIFR